MAANWNRLPVLDLLLASGAEVDAKDNEGKTALAEATKNGHPDCVRRLLHAGADPDAVSHTGATAVDGLLSLGMLGVKHAEIALLLFKVSGKDLAAPYYGKTLPEWFAQSPDAVRMIRAAIADDAIAHELADLAGAPAGAVYRPATKKSRLAL